MLVDPGQLSLVAVLRRAGKACGVEQVHVLGRPDVRDERDKAAVAELCQRQAGLFKHLAAHAVLRTFLILKFSADADPFVMIFVVRLLDAVEHQVLPVLLQIAKRGLFQAFDLRSDIF